MGLLGVELREDLRNGGEVLSGKGRREEGEEEESDRVLGMSEYDISCLLLSFYCFSCFYQ